MAQSRYHITQVNPAIVESSKKEAATIFYLAQSYNLGICIGELVGMGCNPNELRQAFEALLTEAIRTRGKPVIST